MDFVVDFLLHDDGVRVIAATILVLVLTAILYWFATSKTDRSSVLLVGIPGSGKTHLFAQLVSGETKETVTSLRENEAMYNTSADTSGKTKQLSLVDIPGSSSIREQIFDNYKYQIIGMIYIIDGSTISRNIKDVAAYLYQLLIDDVISKFHPHILIACNKQDLLQSKSKRVIQGLLENELNTVRKTQNAQLSDEDGAAGDATSGNNVFLGKKNENFKFEHLSKFNVKFCECSGKPGGEENENIDISEVKEWINSL